MSTKADRYRQNTEGNTKEVLKGTHLPVEIKEIQVGYFKQPLFQGHLSISGPN